MAILTLSLWPPVVVLVASLASGGMVWPTLIADHVGCIGIPRISMREAGLASMPTARWIILTLATSALILLAFLVAGFLLRSRGFQPPADMQAFLSTEPWGLFGVYWILVNPFAEEYYWRGFLQPKTGLIRTSACFALMHYPLYAAYVGWAGALPSVLAPLAAGFFWGWLKNRSGSLWPALITHTAVNAGMYIAATMLRG
ncbi:MAG: CPBP family intramembrane metalloprotease [Nitrospirae bacterium]|nr:CPBP family intramembrane metalloprotease [Nitrospirota bacterium]